MKVDVKIKKKNIQPELNSQHPNDAAFSASFDFP